MRELLSKGIVGDKLGERWRYFVKIMLQNNIIINFIDILPTQRGILEPDDYLKIFEHLIIRQDFELFFKFIKTLPFILYDS